MPPTKTSCTSLVAWQRKREVDHALRARPIIVILLLTTLAFSLIPTATLVVVPPTPDMGGVVRGPTEVGARLAAYTPHVPIHINGTHDFIAQGWPGSGTVDDPFIISGLNITYDIGVPLIEIVNTSAYFIIRDCVLNQLSAGEVAVNLMDTFEATLEYLTITSVHEGISLTDADYTRVWYSEIESQSDSIAVITSPNVELHNLTLTTSKTAAMVGFSRGFSMEYVTVQGDPSWYAFIIGGSDWLDLTSVTVNQGFAFASISGCSHVHVSDSVGLDVTHGIVVSDIDDLQVDNCRFDTRGGGYGFFAGSPFSTDLVFRDCEFTGGTTAIALGSQAHNTYVAGCTFSSWKSGIQLSDAHNFTLANSTLEEIDTGEALSLDNLSDVTVTGNSFSDIAASDAIYLTDTVDVLIQGNTFADVSHAGLNAYGVNDTVFRHNAVTSTGNGIWAEQAHNWTMYSNNFTDVTAALSFYNCSDLLARMNRVDKTSGVALYFDDLSGSLNITENWIEKCDSNSIYVTSVTGSVIVEHNSVMECEHGVYLADIDKTVVQFNYLRDVVQSAIFVVSIPDCTVFNNTIAGESVAGIAGAFVRGASFVNNTMTGCGFYFMSGYPVDSYVFTMENNMVNGLPVYYGFNETGIGIDGSLYGEIIVINSTNVIVHGGYFPSSTSAVLAYYSTHVEITGITARNSVAAIVIDDSDDVTVTDCSFDGSPGTWIVRLEQFNNLTLRNVTVLGHGSHGYAMHLENGVGLVLDNVRTSNTFSNYFYDVDNVTMTNCEFAHTAFATVQVSESQYWVIDGSTFIDGQYGLYMTGSTDCVINGSTFMYATYYGIYAPSSSDRRNNVTHCYFEGSESGLYLSDGQDWNILYNTFRWNTQYGLRMRSTTGVAVYGNTFVGNMISNGYDDQVEYWDDGVDTGNMWDDYSGSGVYTIAGAGATDRYPSRYLPTTPILSNPLDVEYPEGTNTYEVVWYALDDSLSHWVATMDGQPLAQDAWDYDNITIDVGGLPYGDHVLVLTLYDVDQNNVTDTLYIHVYDDTPPQVTGPDYVIAFSGGTDQTISWKVNDLHPANYSIYVDDDLYAEGEWSGDEIAMNVAGLSPGDYVITIVVRDQDLNEATAITNLRMLMDTDTPTLDSPSDITIYVGSYASIVWTGTDEHPDAYEVAMNSTAMESGPWGGGTIVFSLDGLDVGHYEFTLTVRDAAGKTATDTVRVTVVALPPSVPPGQQTTTTTTPAGGFEPMTLAMVAAGGVVVVAVIGGALYVRKRRSS